MRLNQVNFIRTLQQRLLVYSVRYRIRRMDARAAVDAADSRALLMSVVQLTGDRGPLSGLRAVLDWGARARLTDKKKAALGETAAALLEKYSDGGGELPPLPSPDVLLDMMSVSAGEVIP